MTTVNSDPHNLSLFHFAVCILLESQIEFHLMHVADHPFAFSLQSNDINLLVNILHSFIAQEVPSHP